MFKEEIESLGIVAPKAVYRNLVPAKLVEFALARGEGTLSESGALVVTTGKYTGRSPDDRYVVDAPAIHDDIDWGKINVPISEEKYEAIYNRMSAYLQGRELFVFDGYAGADETYHLPVRVVNELASQNLFIHQLLVRPTQEQLASFVPGFTIIAVGQEMVHFHRCCLAASLAERIVQARHNFSLSCCGRSCNAQNHWRPFQSR